MHTSSHDVLIVGAGPAGLTMACELARRGISYRIVDQAAQPATTSRAIGLQARSLELFAALGVVEAACEQGIPGIQVNSYSNGGLAFRLNFRMLADETIPYPYGILLPQNLTEQILIDRLHTLGGHVERARDVVGFQQTGERVIATVHHRDDGSAEQIEAGWLIGCDGAHSAVRKAAGIAFEGSTYPESFLLADVDLDWERSRDSVHVWLHSQGQLGAFPLPGNHWRLMADLPVAPGAPAPQASLELFAALLRERANDTSTTLRNPIWMSTFSIHRRLAATYRQNRVFLVGDAAHVHSPFGGQGANTGIQDAVNLAWKLALVIDGHASEALLESYEEERRPIARQVLGNTDRLTSVFYQRTLLMRALREHIVLPLLTHPAIQRRLLWEASELGIQYRASSLSHHARRGLRSLLSAPRTALQAGDRAPDGRCIRMPEGEATTLFQLSRDPRAQVLLFDGAIQPGSTYATLQRLARQIEDLFAPVIQVHLVASGVRLLAWEGPFLYDVEHRVHAHYGLHGPSLAVIRPDGYLGLLCPLSDEQELSIYLNQLYACPQSDSSARPVPVAGRASMGLPR